MNTELKELSLFARKTLDGLTREIPLKDLNILLDVKSRVPVMLAGYAGCGKTQLINGLLQKTNPAEHLFSVINFNFYTNAVALQVTLEAPLEKKTGTNFGPPGKAQMIFFVDDLNLPEVDRYNTQSAIALVRQHIDYGHVYDRQKLTLKNLLNCQYIAGMNPTAGSFLIDQRLQRHFVTFAIGFPGPTSLHTIYNTSAANFHYEFNIRHMSNVVRGLLMARPEEFKEPDKLVLLRLHEIELVYGDRLVNYDDLNKYKQLALSQAKKRFPSVNVAPFFASQNADPLVFCNFAEGMGERTYDRVRSLDKLRPTLEEAPREYNEANAAMDLVLFEDAVRHVRRFSRVVLNPSGHARLVGVGGSGKQSLSRLPASICGYSVYQITISGTYGMNDLKEDLKAMYNRAAMKDEGIMFLFTDSQITNERFLVMMNDLLASGNIPDLYAVEEKDEIINNVASKVKAEGIVPERANCWKWFLDQVRRNLHVVLCFSPVGDDARTRATKLPALIINWFEPWPKEALMSVGKKFLAKIGLGSDNVRAGIQAFITDPIALPTTEAEIAGWKSCGPDDRVSTENGSIVVNTACGPLQGSTWVREKEKGDNEEGLQNMSPSLLESSSHRVTDDDGVRSRQSVGVNASEAVEHTAQAIPLLVRFVPSKEEHQPTADSGKQPGAANGAAAAAAAAAPRMCSCRGGETCEICGDGACACVRARFFCCVSLRSAPACIFCEYGYVLFVCLFVCCKTWCVEVCTFAWRLVCCSRPSNMSCRVSWYKTVRCSRSRARNADDDDSFTVFVQRYGAGRKDLPLKITGGSTVGDLKQKIAERLGLLPAQMRLVLEGEDLVDDATMTESNIAPGQTVRLEARGLGGGGGSDDDEMDTGRRDIVSMRC